MSNKVFEQFLFPDFRTNFILHWCRGIAFWTCCLYPMFFNGAQQHAFFCGLCVLLLELLAFSSWELERFIPGWFLRNLSWMVAVGWMKINQYEGHVEPTLHCDMPEMPYPLMAQASLELSGSMRLLRLSFCMLPFKLCRLCFEFWLNLGQPWAPLVMQLMPCACCLPDFPGQPERIRPSGFGYA